MGRIKRRLSSVILGAVLAMGITYAPSPADACPNCKLNVEDATNAAESGSATASRGNMAAGYFYSILFMMSMPFIMVTGLVVAIRRQALRDANAHDDLYR